MNDTINGVDRQRLSDTIDAIKATPSLAAFNFRIANRWIDGGENRSTVDGYFGAGEEHRRATPFQLVNDEPPVLLSCDKGANPVENLLHALAGCVTTSIAYHAAAMGRKIDGIRTSFDGDLDLRGFLGLSDEVRNGFKAIDIVFEIDGDLDEAEKRELVQIARDRSPVFDMVANGVPVRTRLAESRAAAA